MRPSHLLLPAPDRDQIVAWLNALLLNGPVSVNRNQVVDALLALKKQEPEEPPSDNVIYSVPEKETSP